jgi:hypothetical protein
LLKPPKKGIKVERRKIEEMNQFRLKYIYTWKCHKETPYVAILTKQKHHFFSFIKLENRRDELAFYLAEVGSDTSGRGEDVGKGCRRMNMVQILCTHVCKWKYDIC